MSDLTLYDSARAQYYLIGAAHGLLSTDRMGRCNHGQHPLFGDGELRGSRYTLRRRDTRVERQITSSPVLCFKDNEHSNTLNPEDWLMDMAAIPAPETELKELAKSEELPLRPMEEAMIRVMDRTDLHQIIETEGISRQMRGIVQPCSTSWVNNKAFKRPYIEFKLNDPHLEYV